ncbi:MAG: ImmA/IrrE family metallo-endopeptidase [Ignavibacteria bacterium]|nr:ImmA/IrrE family metallo-endopeptidase [Ignavibacteria bacterium]
MNYKKIRVPYLDNKDIDRIVEQFREKFWHNKVPVDIEHIIEIKLKIGIVPIPNFLKIVGIDALIASNWQTLYVDNDEYMNERSYNRLRFSLTHEIGHFVLHKEIYASFNVKSFDDYYKLNENIPYEQYGYLETQANKFANYLLVPRKILKIERSKLLEKVKEDFKKVNIEKLNSYLAIPLSEVFKVSDEVVAIALNDLNYKELS